MKRALRMLLVAGAFSVMLFVAGAARAEEDTTNNARTQSAQEIFKWINFAIVAGAGVWLFGKVLPPKFRGNAEKINSAIAKATEAKAESDRLLREAEHKLANLEKVVAALAAPFIRMILSGGAGIWLYADWPLIHDHGFEFITWMIVFYVVTLAVETRLLYIDTTASADARPRTENN